MPSDAPLFESLPSQGRRVVVTGFGCVTPLGVGSSSSWSALISGQTARGPISVIPVQGCRVTEGAQVHDIPLQKCRSGRLSRMSRAARLMLPAVQEALAMAKLLDATGFCSQPYLETAISTTACGMEMGENFLHSVWNNAHRGRFALVAHYQAQQQILEMQKRFRFSGPSMLVANACAGGANAIGHGADLIRAGMADVVLCGGYDALCELVFTGFDCLQSLSPTACRPFDRDRDGLMLGEGAGFLVLEEESHALHRGGIPRAVICGYGHSTDTGHLTQPDQEGRPLEKAMRQALSMAKLDASGVGYVNAHGTATPFNDGAEAKAFHRVFGGAATRLSSTKAATGHTLGAAGAIEAVFSILALTSGALPPQINVRNPEPLVERALVRLGEVARLQAVMSVNLGFGGSNAALILSAP